MLEAFLDWQRATLLCKIAGLSDQDLRRRHVPSGLTLLGIVK
ncbi:MAG: DinB family protein, partial [Chloroflexota bacterium]|nr:DinB family protein [Chloroflexota bacterium]